MAAFSRLATSKLYSAVCKPITYVSVPSVTDDLGIKLACMEINKSAFASLAIFAR